ncbi:MAG TPA: acylphosphatase [Gallionellaceae bacterium]|nr:acylphosphatase [Gallionellaceae bacterium]
MFEEHRPHSGAKGGGGKKHPAGCGGGTGAALGGGEYLVTDTHRTLRLRIHGRVQGVFFRDSMRSEAKDLGISGWVRNCADGSVEAVVHGAAADVDAIVRWAHRGPSRAQVTHVEVSTDAGVYSSFEVRYD